ncbi:uncharacterized protein LOC123715929 [Pieris brassicae]|uniref:uncharacterized protein LOC123715929 n=1 Tax=Pieris brassicae TaxID=7116 RepID=UPI001E661AF7|nr:uncharacterized protein LOC123715929 [Pieris brassicae]
MRMSIVKGILYFRLAVGNYWECSSSKIVQFLCKLYCVMYISVSTYLNFSIGFAPESLIAYYEVNLFFFFIINGVLSIWNKQEYFTRFYSGIRTIDNIIHFTKPKSAWLVAYLILIVFKSAGNIIMFLHLKFILSLAIQMAEISRTISNLPSVMIYEMLWSRMAFLRKWLNSKLIHGNLDEKQFCLRKFLHLYKTLLDNVTKVYKILALQAFIELVYHFTKLLFDTHSSIVMMLTGSVDLKFSLTLFVTSVLDFVVMISGPLFLELTLREYEKLMSLITTELVQCKDRTYREQILTTLEYLEVRPPRYTVWRIVSMNLKLMVTVVQLLVTYVIVLLSFQF